MALRPVIHLWVGGLLVKTFLKTLARQVYLKLTKFTRRSSGPRSFLAKFSAGCQFLRAMSEYNLDVIRRSRVCLETLTAENVSIILVYGEKDIVEVLRILSLQNSVEVKLVREVYEPKRKLGVEAVPVEAAICGNEKILIASLVNTQARMKRLLQLGIGNDRILILAHG